ncbi:MAG: type III-B CRISPR module RAMP protein Cmr6 [Nitrospirae bacterium]|nr:type III-B CRISPR module RAMP protein Cmr6 [Nitrospirota bacterium]
MKTPLYCAHDAPLSKPQDAHSGLWFDRFFNRFTDSWETEKEGAKLKWIVKTVEGSCCDMAAVKSFSLRQYEIAASLGGESRAFTTSWRFASGLGLPHPVENGFAWHPTLGTPYLTGAAVKGLVRAWVEVWEPSFDDRIERDNRLKSWFGEIDQSGGLIFFDAIPVAPPALSPDVMTPHMGKWYELGGEIGVNPENEPKSLPADWHDPNPIPFLTVKNGTFLFSIAPRNQKFTDDVPLAMDSLKQALEWLGAGAKTAAGYGRMEPDDVARNSLKVEADKRMKDRLERESVARMSPLERELHELAKNNSQDTEVFFLKALEDGRWNGDNARVVAEKIQAMMQEKDKWKPVCNSKEEKKLKLHRRTLAVMRYLGR